MQVIFVFLYIMIAILPGELSSISDFLIFLIPVPRLVSREEEHGPKNGHCAYDTALKYICII